MRELNMMELDAVSGAGLFSALTSAVLGGVAGMTFGSLVAVNASANGGGLLGLGIIAEGVGMLYGAVLGGIYGVVAGAIVGYNDPDSVTSLVIQATTNTANSI